MFPGDTGLPGPVGPKGEPGESISAPKVIVMSASETVIENQTALFYCSAVGNPKPKISWSKLNGSGLVNRNGQQNKLEIKNATYSDSGKYVCTAKNVLGQDQKVVELLVEGKIVKIQSGKPVFNYVFYLNVLSVLKVPKLNTGKPILMAIKFFD